MWVRHAAAWLCLGLTVLAAGPNVPAARALLGRYLFYDTRLSVNGTQACASCHRQELAFTDGRATARGATGQDHPRSSMSLVNVGSSSLLTWSNPALHSLEEQALIPMFSEHSVELGLRGHEPVVLELLRTDPVYRDLFPRAFPGETAPFTIANLTLGLAAFERTIVSKRSAYDRYHIGGDASAITESAKRGEVLFFTDPVAGCFRCHPYPDFSDGSAHNTALYRDDPRKFKAPTLRNIAVTAPYMHDGSIATLEGVLDHYAAGGRAHQNPNRDARMRPIAFTPQNRADLIEFLRSLTDEELLADPRFSPPASPTPR